MSPEISDRLTFTFCIYIQIPKPMAEAENIDVGDPYLQNLTIKPARHINRESQTHTSKSKDNRRRGFNKLRAVVIEGKHIFIEFSSPAK